MSHEATPRDSGRCPTRPGPALATRRRQATGAGAAPGPVFDVCDLETGAAPRVAWAETDRRPVRHPRPGRHGTVVDGNVRAFAPMGSGYVVQTGGARPATVRWIAADGTPGPISSGARLRPGGLGGRRGRRLHRPEGQGDASSTPRATGCCGCRGCPGRGSHTTPAARLGRGLPRGRHQQRLRGRRSTRPVARSAGSPPPTASSTAPRSSAVSTGRGRWLGGDHQRHRHGDLQRHARGVRARSGRTCRNQLLRRLPRHAAPARHPGVRRRLRPDPPRRPRPPHAATGCGRGRPDRRGTLGDVLRRGLGGPDPPARRDLPGRRVGDRAARYSTARWSTPCRRVADRWDMETPFHLQNGVTCPTLGTLRTLQGVGEIPDAHRRWVLLHWMDHEPPARRHPHRARHQVDRPRRVAVAVRGGPASSPPSWPTCRTTRPPRGCRSQPSPPAPSRSSSRSRTPTPSPPSSSTNVTAG